MSPRRPPGHTYAHSVASSRCRRGWCEGGWGGGGWRGCAGVQGVVQHADVQITHMEGPYGLAYSASGDNLYLTIDLPLRTRTRTPPTFAHVPTDYVCQLGSCPQLTYSCTHRIIPVAPLVSKI